MKKILKELAWIVGSLLVAIDFGAACEWYAAGSNYKGFPLSVSVGFGVFCLCYGYRFYDLIRFLIKETIKEIKEENN